MAARPFPQETYCIHCATEGTKPEPDRLRRARIPGEAAPAVQTMIRVGASESIVTVGSGSGSAGGNLGQSARK